MKTINDEITGISFNEKQLEIFEEIINYPWAEVADSIRKTLFLLGLTYIRSERIEGDNSNTRSKVAYHLEILNDLISDMRHCELNITDESKKKQFFEESYSAATSDWSDLDFERDLMNTVSILSLEFIRSEEIEQVSIKEREMISSNLVLIQDLIKKIQRIQAARD